MKKSFKFFAKITCALLALCLTTTGCAYGQQGKTTPSTEASEVIAAETVSDIMPVNISLGDDWCYLRFNLSRERLEELANNAEDITLTLPGCTVDDNAFHIRITKEDVTQSLRLLKEHPEQQSVNLIKPLSVDDVKGLGETEDDLYYVYYLLTMDDVLRMLDGLQSANSDTIFLKQRLDIDSDRVAVLRLEYLALVRSLEILCSTEQVYIPYICPVDPPEKVTSSTDIL